MRFKLIWERVIAVSGLDRYRDRLNANEYVGHATQVARCHISSVSVGARAVSAVVDLGSHPTLAAIAACWLDSLLPESGGLWCSSPARQLDSESDDRKNLLDGTALEGTSRAVQTYQSRY